MSMDYDDRKSLIAYRHEKADMALEDATFLTDAGKYGLAANRLYYACEGPHSEPQGNRHNE